MKKADKVSNFTITSPEFYCSMYKKHLNITEYYRKVMHYPKKILQEKVDDLI